MAPALAVVLGLYAAQRPRGGPAVDFGQSNQACAHVPHLADDNRSILLHSNHGRGPGTRPRDGKRELDNTTFALLSVRPGHHLQDNHRRGLQLPVCSAAALD